MVPSSTIVQSIHYQSKSLEEIHPIFRAEKKSHYNRKTEKKVPSQRSDIKMTNRIHLRFEVLTAAKRNCGNPVIIVPDNRLDKQCSIPGKEKGFLFQPLCPDCLWDSPCLLVSGYWGGLLWE
jgi:hypothetical protein